MYLRILLASVFIIFLYIKYSFLAARLSDTNVYIGIADYLLKGSLLYKDIFLTNLPLFPYISALWLAITGGNVWLFYFTGGICAALTAYFLYLCSKELFKKSSRWMHLIIVSLYLFSFTVLTTSDHQTGIFFATMFAVLSLYLYLTKKFVLAGITLGLCFMTKGYFIPIASTFLLYDVITRKKDSFRYLVSFAATCFIIFLPTLIFAFPDFLKQVFGYSLSRSAGINKTAIFYFFFLRDWVIGIGLVSSFIFVRKNLLLTLLLVNSLIFLLLFKDIYFFYLNMFVPFACLALGYPFLYLKSKTNTQIAFCIFLSVLGVAILMNIPLYIDNYAKVQKIEDVTALVQAIQKENPDRLYGPTEISSLLHHVSGVPLLNDIIDPNTNMFRSGVYSAKTQTEEIFKQKTVVVSFGAEYDNLQVKIISEIYDPKTIEAKCKIVYTQPVQAEDIYNRIHVWRCY